MFFFVFSGSLCVTMEKLHNHVGHQCARVLFTEDATSQGIEMVSVFTGLLGEEGRVNISVDTRLLTDYLYTARLTIRT